MRRTLAGLVGLLLLAVAGPALAQAPPYTFSVNSGPVYQYTTASVRASNITTPVALWSSIIPAALIATTSNTNWTPSKVQTPVPLHLILHGMMSTVSKACSACAPSFNMGVNFGGGSAGVATITLASAKAPPLGLRQQPVVIDVWYNTIATAVRTNTPGSGQGLYFLKARMAITNNATAAFNYAVATETLFNALAFGKTGPAFTASAQQLNIIFQWSSASLTNSLNIYSGTLLFGN